MLHAELVAVEELAERLETLRGQRFVARAREVVALAEPLSESPGESRLRLRIVDAGFPRPGAQIPVHDNGVLSYRLDLGYRKSLRAFERQFGVAQTQRLSFGPRVGCGRLGAARASPQWSSRQRRTGIA